MGKFIVFLHLVARREKWAEEEAWGRGEWSKGMAVFYLGVLLEI